MSIRQLSDDRRAHRSVRCKTGPSGLLAEHGVQQKWNALSLASPKSARYSLEIEINCDACNGTGCPTIWQPVQHGRKIYPAPCKKYGVKGRLTKADRLAPSEISKFLCRLGIEPLSYRPSAPPRSGLFKSAACDMKSSNRGRQRPAHQSQPLITKWPTVHRQQPTFVTKSANRRHCACAPVVVGS